MPTADSFAAGGNWQSQSGSGTFAMCCTIPKMAAGLVLCALPYGHLQQLCPTGLMGSQVLGSIGLLVPCGNSKCSYFLITPIPIILVSCAFFLSLSLLFFIALR